MPAPANQPAPRTRRHARRVGVAAACTLTALVLLVLVLATPAFAQAPNPVLDQVIIRLRNVLVGLCLGLGTLFLTIAGVRYLAAGGDPSQIEKAKTTLRSAMWGYGLAVLAPVLMAVLRYVVGQ